MNLNNCCGQKLNIIAVTIANAISEGMNDDEINLLAGILQLVGEALAVIPAARVLCNPGSENNENVIER